MLVALPLAFGQELDSCGVNLQMQSGGPGPVCNLYLQTALSTAQRAEMGTAYSSDAAFKRWRSSL